jgi:hypothetical protein
MNHFNMNIYHFSSGHDYLKGLFSSMSEGRSAYSYNAFSRDLNIGSASLHRFLNGERSLSRKSLEKISESLNLKEEEKSYLKRIFQVTPASDELKLNQDKIVSDKIEISNSDELIIHEVVQFLNDLEKKSKIRFLKSEVFPQEVLHFLLKYKLVSSIGDDSFELLNPSKNVTLKIKNKFNSSFASHYHLILYETLDHLKAKDPSCRGVGSELLLFDEDTFLEAKESLNSFLDNLILISKKSKKPEITAQCFSVIFKKD